MHQNDQSELSRVMIKDEIKKVTKEGQIAKKLKKIKTI